MLKGALGQGVLRLSETVGDGQIQRQNSGWNGLGWHSEVPTGSRPCTRLWMKCLVSRGEPDMDLALMELRSGWR